jgi:hypothetical protein
MHSSKNNFTLTSPNVQLTSCYFYHIPPLMTKRTNKFHLQQNYMQTLKFELACDFHSQLVCGLIDIQFVFFDALQPIGQVFMRHRSRYEPWFDASRKEETGTALSAPQPHCIRKCYAVFTRPDHVNSPLIIRIAREVESMDTFYIDIDIFESDIEFAVTINTKWGERSIKAKAPFYHQIFITNGLL